MFLDISLNDKCPNLSESETYNRICTALYDAIAEYSEQLSDLNEDDHFNPSCLVLNH